MKLLHVIWGFAGGGVDKVVESYARMPAHAPVDAHFVCLYGDGWSTDRNGLDAIGATSITFRNRRDLSWIRRLAAHIDRTGPDLVFAHGFNAPVATALALRKASHRPPLLCSYHGSYHAPRRSRKPLEPVFNGGLHWVYRHRAAGVVAVAEHARRFLIARGIAPDKVTTIHNGLPDEISAATQLDRAEFGLCADDFVIGAASRLAPEKGLTHLLDAMPAICASVPHARLLILGDGPEEGALRSRAQQLDIGGKVIFAGFRADAAAFLDLYDVFALPSLAEYHSIALLEAMRAGRPIVATEVGGNPESVRDRQEALLVPPADPIALAQAVQRLAHEPPLARSLSSAAKARFKNNFSEAVMLRRTQAWLQDKLDPS